jgi:hypothetical protein
MRKKNEAAQTPAVQETTGTAVVGYQHLGGLDIADMMSELDGMDIVFERIKIPSAGSTVFEVPGEDGEPEMAKTFDAVVLYHHPLNTYYNSKYTGGNNPPDCGSYDGVHGEGAPGGDCKTCPYNQYGTGDNDSKLCKNRQRMYLLREGEIFPLLLSLPPGSRRVLTRYIQHLLTKGKKTNQVVTQISLKKATNKSGVEYSQAQFKAIRELSQEEHAAISKLTEQFMQFTQHVALDFDNSLYTDEGGIQPMAVDPQTGEIYE